jgi:hypothetical protein
VHSLLIVCHDALYVGIEEQALSHFGVHLITRDRVVTELKAVVSATIFRLGIRS